MRYSMAIAGLAAGPAMIAPAAAQPIVVHDATELSRARPVAGDTIVLADGEWRDASLALTGEGTEQRPITLTAEHPGKVFLTGRSSLKLAGRWLVAANLVFRNGYTPSDEVVSFRTDSRHWADHSRVTGIVVDRYNQPDRRKEDHWVAIYGTGNRVDHSQFEGKGNEGAMMIVVRDHPYPLDNRSRIDHNYFGPRPTLGGNGGETIRIGTSTESQSDSHSIVEDNLFDRCDGEVEIVSVKSGANLIRRNTFLKSQGAVVLRHGNGNTVENNVFLGHGVPRTAGIRVINRDQTVRGNYLEGLAGTDFLSALTLMNGVPNSPINRYLPVERATIANNSVIDAARITLGGGADAERSVAPASTQFVADLIVNKASDPIDIRSSTAGIVFENVIQSPAGKPALSGISRRDVALARAANGLLYPTDTKLKGVGAPRDLAIVRREDVGVAWYPKGQSVAAAFDSGARHEVTSSAALPAAVAAARPGDVVWLAAGHYTLAAPIVIDRPLTVAGARSGAVTLAFSSPTLFQLENGGSLKLTGVSITGANAPHAAGNAVIRASVAPMSDAYRIALQDCSFSGMASPGFDVVHATPATLARDVTITGSRFDGISGAVVAGHAETGKEGFYSTEEVTIRGSDFRRVGAVADLYRGGTDESSFGPRFTMTGSTIAQSGEAAGSVLLSGVQDALIDDNRFLASGGIRVTHSVGTPHTVIEHNLLARTPAPVVTELYYRGPPRAVIADNEAKGA